MRIRVLGHIVEYYKEVKARLRLKVEEAKQDT